MGYNKFTVTLDKCTDEIVKDNRFELTLFNRNQEHKIYFIQTEEGFIIDTYKKDDEGEEYNVTSSTVWDED